MDMAKTTRYTKPRKNTRRYDVTVIVRVTARSQAEAERLVGKGSIDVPGYSGRLDATIWQLCD